MLAEPDQSLDFASVGRVEVGGEPSTLGRLRQRAEPRAVHSELVPPTPHAATVPYSDVGDATWFTCDQVPA
ncbi:hypothetical protein GCM10027614_21040 [Micromonospora vulcania]